MGDTWQNFVQLVRESLTTSMGNWGSGLRPLGKNEGVDTYGQLQGQLGVKGRGYFGPVKAIEGYMTELSTEDESGAYPLVVPTLSKDELTLLGKGEVPTPEIYKKARAHADLRRAQGLDPFSDNTGLTFPLPTK